jgi:hypothetical protein
MSADLSPRAKAARQLVEDDLVELGGHEKLLFADGFDEALIGYVERFGNEGRVQVALYDRRKCIEILMQGGMDLEGAVEHFEFNVIGAYVGEYTPAFATIPEPPEKT